MWQISLILDRFKTVFVKVPENCTGAELYEAVKTHPEVPKADGYTLTALDEGEIEDSSSIRLEDYGVGHLATIHLTMRLHGGVWPTEKSLEETPRNLIFTGKLKITTSEEHPDVFGLDFDSPRVIMSCGHAVAPLSLAIYCLLELENGKDAIVCPDLKCNTIWKFSQAFDAACLSQDERSEFERRALLNKMNQKREEIKSCPKCRYSSSRVDTTNKRVLCSNCTRQTGEAFEFCWICLREWKTGGTGNCGNSDCGVNRGTFEILAKCPLKILNGIQCPSQRGCPQCFTLVEHITACKHMTCRACKYEFCFICLKKYPCETGVYEACEVAPRQEPSK